MSQHIYVESWVKSAARDVLTEFNKALQKVPGQIRSEFFKHFPPILGPIESAIARNAIISEPIKDKVDEIPVMLARPGSDTVAALAKMLSGKSLRLNQMAPVLGISEDEALAALQGNPATFELGPKGWWRLAQR